MESLAKLSKNDHHRVTQTILKLKDDVNASGLRLHKVNDFLSVSAGMDLRVITTPWKEGYALHYTDHHDKAYLWASNHTLISDESKSFLEFLPNTFVVQGSQDTSAIHQKILPQSYGIQLASRLADQSIPAMLINKIQLLDSEDSLLELIHSLSPWLQERILNAATGSSTDIVAAKGSSRVAVINDDDELEKAFVRISA